MKQLFALILLFLINSSLLWASPYVEMDKASPSKIQRKAERQEKRVQKLWHKIKKKQQKLRKSKKRGKREWISRAASLFWSFLFFALVALALLKGGFWMILLIIVLGLAFIAFLFLIITFSSGFQMC